jgi:hypothetical protein
VAEPTKFVFAGIGTKGDSLPMLALGRELVNRGHRCDLLGNASYGGLAEQSRMGFVPVTIDQTNNLLSAFDDLEHHVLPSYEATFQYFDTQIRAGERPFVVNWNHFSASNLMCERYELPLCRLYLSPYFVKSVVAPPQPYARNRDVQPGVAAARYDVNRIYERMSRFPYFISRVRI